MDTSVCTITLNVQIQMQQSLIKYLICFFIISICTCRPGRAGGLRALRGPAALRPEGLFPLRAARDRRGSSHADPARRRRPGDT